MKILPLFVALAALATTLTGCVTSYDCGMQADDAMSFEACRQTKGSPAYRYCTDNHRYKNFAECAQHATKDGAENCLARKAPRPDVYECLNGKGKALVTPEEKAKQKPLPKLNLDPDPKPASKGTGQFVTGIVLTSALPALGLLSYASAKSADCEKEEKEKDRRDCEDLKASAPAGAALLAGLGVGIGLPLLFDGLEKRRVYREWLARHPEANKTTLRLNLVPLARGGALAALTYDLN